MKKYLVFLSFILLTTILFSQNPPDTLWTRNLGGNVASSMKITSDGGYILAGNTGSSNSYSFYLVKTDENGNEEWNKVLNNNSNQGARSIQQTMDGGYITVGFTEGINLNVWLIKTDEVGNIIWDEEYGDENEFDLGNDVIQTEDGGYVITGLTDSYNVTERNVLLLKTDNIGNVEWINTYGGDNLSIGYSVIKTDDNGYIIAGFTNFANDNEDIYIVKTDSIGNVIWENTYGGDEEDIAQSIKQTDDGGYIITGWTTSFGSGSWDVMILKIDEFGNEEWSNYFGGDQRDQGYDGYVLEDGYIFTGYTESYGNGTFDMWVIKTDELGNEKWNKTVGSTDAEFGYSILQTDNLEYIIAGNLQIYGDNNFWLVKTERDFKAEFCVSDTFGYAPINVEFINTSLGSPSIFEWDFNNDSIIDSFEENPIWNYEEPGCYSVSLTISDGMNTDTELKEEYITIYIPLIAEFEANITSGIVPLEIQFADLSTGNIIEWSWDFENDGTIDSNEQNPSWIYEESDIYTVSLTISDGINTDIETKVEYISVYDSLIAEFVADSTLGFAPLEVQFTDLSTHSQNPIIIWEWDFQNDGIIDSYLQNPIYTYSEAGIYTVSLTVSDGVDEDIEIKEDYITVIEPLDADFEADVTSGDAPLEVQFTDLSTGQILGWMWDFDNDGTIDSNEQNPIYTYNDAGVYTVSLTITDGSNEDTEIKEDYITVIFTGVYNEVIPLETKLYQNHPNPFNPVTNIQFDIKKNETGVLSIYNIKGQWIISQQFEAGQHNFQWDASEQSSGVYLYKLQTESFVELKKMLLLK